MTDPSPEVVAAALALAEKIASSPPNEWVWRDDIRSAAKAYRAAIAPKRTRAEVDAELCDWIRSAVESKLHINQTWERVLRLCGEQTAPEPDPKPCLTCAECGLTSRLEPTVAMRWDDVVRCNACANKRPLGVPPLEDPDGCGCEASDALREQLRVEKEGHLLTARRAQEIHETCVEQRKLLDYARRGAQDIVTILKEGRK